MTEEIAKMFIEAQKEMEMPKEKLLEKLWDLEQRIHNALEYIEENKLNGNKISEMLCGSEVLKLLEILRGKDE